MLHVERSLRSERGLTLVELLIVMVLAGLIIGVTWTVMTGAWGAWARTSTDAALDMQSGAGLMAVSAKMRIASSVDAADPASPVIKVNGPSGETVYSFSVEGTDLKMITTAPGSSSTIAPVARDVASFQVVATEYTGSYVISVVCERSGISKTASTQITVRR
jgi:prepilin-type N-terminal cleavage/methylation domain-containing protein